jgi:hypothetical protein
VAVVVFFVVINRARMPPLATETDRLNLAVGVQEVLRWFARRRQTLVARRLLNGRRLVWLLCA